MTTAGSGKLGSTTVRGREIDRLEAAKGVAVLMIMGLVTVGVIPVVDQEPLTEFANGALGLFGVFFIRP